MPFRPQPKTPNGKTQWREVKVGLLVRLGHRLTRTGQQLTRLLRRRLVAVLGDIDTFIPLIQLEAQLQSYQSAPQVVWLSDGGRGFWRVYRQCFDGYAIGILDFYHAAGHLWRATVALFDGQSPDGMGWFRRSLQARSQKVLKLYLAIDSSIVEIFDKSLCSKGRGLCSRESDRRGI